MELKIQVKWKDKISEIFKYRGKQHTGDMWNATGNQMIKEAQIHFVKIFCILYIIHLCVYISSIQFSCSVVSDSLRPHELQHIRPPYPSPTPGVYSNTCPSSWWCHPAISSSIVPFSSCSQSLPASGSFPMSQLLEWGGQSTGVSASASVLPVDTQDWSPLGWTGWISLQSKGLSRVFSNLIVQNIYESKSESVSHSVVSDSLWPYGL